MISTNRVARLVLADANFERYQSSSSLGEICFLASENEIPRLSEETRNKLKCRAKRSLRFGAVQGFIKVKKKEKKPPELDEWKAKRTDLCLQKFILCM